MTLTGRKELGKWNREILPDITFLNAEDFKRLHAEMGKSVEKLKINKRLKFAHRLYRQELFTYTFHFRNHENSLMKNMNKVYNIKTILE